MKSLLDGALVGSVVSLFVTGALCISMLFFWRRIPVTDDPLFFLGVIFGTILTFGAVALVFSLLYGARA